MKWESNPRTRILHRLRDYGGLRSKTRGLCSRVARARDVAAHTGDLRRRHFLPLLYHLSYSFIAVGAFRFHDCDISYVPLGGTFCYARRHLDLYTPGITPSISLAMNQVLLKWANVGSKSSIAVGVFLKAHSLSWRGLAVSPEQRQCLAGICFKRSCCSRFSWFKNTVSS